MASKVFIIQSDSLGRGEERLGTLLMANFLRLLGESAKKPDTIVLLNTGVRLACKDSPVLDYLKRLEQQGVAILSCTTCLEYFDLMDKIQVGKATTMVNTIQLMLDSDAVCL
jgi:selenium metabolism protein YedF